jgi:hypothetical protein
MPTRDPDRGNPRPWIVETRADPVRGNQRHPVRGNPDRGNERPPVRGNPSVETGTDPRPQKPVFFVRCSFPRISQDLTRPETML